MEDKKASRVKGGGGRGVRLTKDEINRLPLVQYEGPVHLVTREDQFRRAVERLGRETILGFDTETQPTFRSGDHHPPALLQLAAPDAVFVFRLSTLSFGDGLLSLLSSPDIEKVGVAPQRDINELKDLKPFQEAGVIDVAELARSAGIEAGGLRSLAAAVLGWRISKRYQTSNWGRSYLHPAQLRYAATDAWVSREIYLALIGAREK
ncbi:MAG TPA: 3'-5' exonuclease [Verrucomicrobiae bacterium]|nr:3'-5' exonuclease [Verrucomicrobiae bacterium]